MGIPTTMKICMLRTPRSARRRALGRGSKSTGFAGILSVELVSVLRFLRDIHEFRYGSLHAESHFMLSNSCEDRIIAIGLVVLLINFSEGIQLLRRVARLSPLGLLR